MTRARGVTDHGIHGVEPRRLAVRYPHLALHVAGITFAVAGAGLLVSALVEALVGGTETLTLAWCGAAVLTVGVVIWRTTRVPDDILLLDIFVTVAVAWIALALAGALPYLATGTLTSPDDAIFEAVSGFTTTGATVLRPIEGTSRGLLFWRSITQWTGGMGVIVLVVAVLFFFLPA